MPQPDARLLILGAGGHGRVFANVAMAEGWHPVVASDRDPARWGSALLPQVPVLSIEEAVARSTVVHVAIGSASSREREAKAVGLPLATIVHPHASVSTHARLDPGCLLTARSVVAPGARIGTCVIVNHGAVVDHDVLVGDYTHIAPLVSLGGGVRIGCRVLVGSGVSVLPGVRIGDDIVVGAGAVVCEDLDVPGVYAGVPARRVR
jgi:sugar O-acyltransferase (sialic acid O-acetyltransferase NeuD family)